MDKRIKINNPQDLADKIKACLDLEEEKNQKYSKELQICDRKTYPRKLSGKSNKYIKKNTYIKVDSSNEA